MLIEVNRSAKKRWKQLIQRKADRASVSEMVPAQEVTMTVQSVARNSGFLHSISEAWNRFRRRRAAAVELQALGNAELERMVRDAGLSFADVLDLARQSGDSASLLYRRLEQAGIDLKALDSAVLRDMQRCCSFCDSKSRCEHDMDTRLDTQAKAAAWPDYCPNRMTVEALGAAKCH
jgi:uncharacterized protein YjiS (DUF1127 family)